MSSAIATFWTVGRERFVPSIWRQKLRRSLRVRRRESERWCVRNRLPGSETWRRAGEQTPMFFGSARTNSSVERFLKHFLQMAPCPEGRLPDQGWADPGSIPFSGFVFVSRGIVTGSCSFHEGSLRGLSKRVFQRVFHRIIFFGEVTKSRGSLIRTCR